MAQVDSSFLQSIQENIQIILDKLSVVETNISILATENDHRTHEIAQLGEKLGMTTKIETDKEENLEITSDNEDDEETEPREAPTPAVKNTNSTRNIRENQTNSRSNTDDDCNIPAKVIIQMIKPLNGHDDMGVEDFIKNVKKAQKKCSQPLLLLEFILASKIVQQAEKAIRYIPIDDYESLYDALRTNVKQTASVSALRSKLDTCRQGPTESVQSFSTRYRQIFNELKYAVQAAHKNPMKRRIAMDIEEAECLKKYLMNLRKEIGLQVKAEKPTTLTEGQNSAIEMELWLKESQSHTAIRTNNTFKPPLRTNILAPTKPANTTSVGASSSRTLTQSTIDKNKQNCHKCGTPGHYATQCHVENTNFRIGQHSNRPPQVQNIQESEETITYDQMTHEEIDEQIQYEESGEYQQFMDDYNQSSEENTTENPIDC